MEEFVPWTDQPSLTPRSRFTVVIVILTVVWLFAVAIAGTCNSKATLMIIVWGGSILIAMLVIRLLISFFGNGIIRSATIRSIAVVESRKGDGCSDTRRVRSFFRDDPKGQGVALETQPEGCSRAYQLALRAIGHFGNRKQNGFPLVVVLDDNDTGLWAACEPTVEELREAVSVYKKT